MQPVESSSIAAIGYSAESRELYVRFRESGETYVYFDVEARVADEFMSAESKGAFFNRRIKDRYAYSLLERQEHGA
jgi:hypothetical protein